MKIRNVFSMFMLAVAMLFVVGCGGSPKSAIENWGEAMLDGDLETANEYTADGSKGMNELLMMGVSADKEGFEEMLEDLLDGEVDYVDSETGNDAAKVSGEKHEIMLVKEDGEWKVCPVK